MNLKNKFLVLKNNELVCKIREYINNIFDFLDISNAKIIIDNINPILDIYRLNNKNKKKTVIENILKTVLKQIFTFMKNGVNVMFSTNVLTSCFLIICLNLILKSFFLIFID